MGRKVCTNCPLHEEGCETNCMPGRGKRRGILFLGENPGSEEDALGKPFVGSSGKLLQALIEDSGLSDVAFFTNITRCKAETIKRKPTIDEIRTCREHLDKEIEVVKPKLIVSLGEYAAKGMTNNNNASVEKLRASTTVYKGIPVFYTYHPSAIHYDRRIADYMREDFKKIRELWNEGVPVRNKGLYYKIRPWSKLSYDLKVNVCALDIETNGFSPYAPDAKIMSISVAPNPDTVYYKYINTTPGSKELIDILEPLRLFRTFVCHKTTFDLGWLTYNLPANHWLWRRDWEDTLIALQFKDEYYPNTSLSHLAEVYANIPKLDTPWFVKEGFPKGWESEENHKTLKKYNCRDTLATYRLWKVIHPTLRDGDALDKIKEGRAYLWVSSNLKTVVRMRHSGIHLNQNRLEELHRTLTRKIFNCEKLLRRSGVDFNSTLAVQKYLFEKLKLPVLKRTEKTKNPSLDSEVMEKLIEKDRTGWVKNFHQRKSYIRVRNTWCKNMREEGKIAHPEVFISRSDEGSEKGGSNTGRVTCKGFINLPRDDDPESKEITIKKCITSRYGKDGVIVAMDYSQMEMRILADQSKDKKLHEAFREGLDLHTYAAALVAGCSMKKVSKDMRQKAKAVNFGIVFGQTAYGLAHTTKMKIHEAKKFIARYMKTFKGVEDYIHSQYQEAEAVGIIYSPLGRVFHLPNAKWIYTRGGEKIPSHDMRKAVNSPIQSAANDFTTEAIRQVQKFIDNGCWNAHIILTVYDSIIMDWNKEHLQLSEFLMPDILKSVFDTSPKNAMSMLGWNVRVPIEFEVSSGPSLGECK